MSVQKIVDSINEQVEAFRADAEEAVKGNKSAARRARKATLKLSELGKEFRKVSVK